MDRRCVPDPAAGRQPPLAGGAACVAALALLAACAANPAVRNSAGGERVLVPWSTIDGGMLVRAADATGTPAVQSGTLGFRRFVHTVAVASAGNDLYIADAGAGVFRFDLASNTMVLLPGIPVGPTSRLAAGRDHSLYVLDAANRRVMLVSRSGTLLASFRSDFDMPRPVDMALDETRGAVLVADGTLVRILAFHPMGRAYSVISVRGDERNRVFSIAAIAAARDAIYISDPVCRCITTISPEGAILGSFGHQDIGQPGPVAVDRYQRVYVVDRFSKSLKVFVAGRLNAELPAASLGLTEVTDVRASQEWLAVADGPGARVGLFRPAQPRRQP